MKNIYFEKVHPYENDPDVKMPCAKTKGSAGYDLFAAEDTIIPPFDEFILSNFAMKTLEESAKFNREMNNKAVLVPTGVTAHFDFPVVLPLFSRSSVATKNNLILPNSVGIIDADYYPNQIFVPMINLNKYPIKIKKGEAIAQALFINVLTTEDDNREDTARQGGFGSTTEHG